MRPPDKRERGRPEWRSGGLAKSYLDDTNTQRNSKKLPARQAPILTAIPANNRWWRLKAVSGDNGETVILPGVFRGRLQALGAAVMLAQKCNGRVVP